MSVEMDANGETKGATVQESRDGVRQRCEMHGVSGQNLINILSQKFN